MVGRQYLRIPFYSDDTCGQWLEAFSFLYAQRSAAIIDGVTTIPARAAESLKRSWDYDQGLWMRRPQDPIGPSVGAWAFDGDYRPKLLITIGGMHSLLALLQLRPGNQGVSIAGYQGYVHALFKTFAENVLEDLQGQPGVWSRMSDLTKPLLIAGFSMGAALSEILAAKIRALFPNKWIRILKCASPRVGNADWQRNWPLCGERASFVVDNDPVQNYPLFSSREWALTTNGPLVTYEQDPPTMIRSIDGQSSLCRNSNPVGFIRATNAIPMDMNPSPGNVWYNHMWETYRLAMSGMAQSFNHDYLGRFIHQEFPNDNIWGRDWRYGMTEWASLISFAPEGYDTEASGLAGDWGGDSERVSIAEVLSQYGDASGSAAGAFSLPRPVSQSASAAGAAAPPATETLIRRRTSVTRTRRPMVTVP